MPSPPDLLASVEGLLRGEGTLADVERALEAGADPNVDQANPAALRRAVEWRHKLLVELLLSRGADANAKDQKGVGPLHIAAFDGSDDCISALLEAGGDANISDKHGQTPLFFASTRKTCELLIAGRADVNVMNNRQQSALHLAAHNGLHENVRFIAEVGGQHLLDMQDKRGLTPLYYAARAGGKRSLGVLQSKGANKTLHVPAALLEAAKQPKRKRLACEIQWENLDFAALSPELLASITGCVSAAVAAEAGVGAENVHVVRQGAGGMRALVNLKDTAAADVLAEVLGAPEFSSALSGKVDGEVSGAFVSEFRVLPDAPKLPGAPKPTALKPLAMSAPAKLSLKPQNVVKEDVEWVAPPLPAETSERPKLPEDLVVSHLELAATAPPGCVVDDVSASFLAQEAKIVAPDDIMSSARTSEFSYSYTMQWMLDEPAVVLQEALEDKARAPEAPPRDAEAPEVVEPPPRLDIAVEPPEAEKAVVLFQEPESPTKAVRSGSTLRPESPVKMVRSAGSPGGSFSFLREPESPGKSRSFGSAGSVLREQSPLKGARPESPLKGARSFGSDGGSLREPGSPLKTSRSAGSAGRDRSARQKRSFPSVDEPLAWDVVLQKRDDAEPFGFSHSDGKRTLERLAGDSDLVGPEHLIIALVARSGALQRWNAKHPEAEVRRHDRICSVNGETSVAGMQRALRGSEVARMRVLRFPERIVLMLPRGERGFTCEPSGSGLRIKELAPEGPMRVHNSQQVALGCWHNFVHSGMHIIAVNETVADPMRLATELHGSSSARLVLLRGRPTAQAAVSTVNSNSSRPVVRAKSERCGCECWHVKLEKTQDGDEFGFATLSGREEFERRTNGALQGPEALIVNRIKPGALLDRWNREHPDVAVVAGDRVCNVNSEISIEGMQHELRARHILLRMVRYPERFSARMAGDTLGCSLEPAEDGSMRITEIAQQGAVHSHNLRQISHGLWQFAVLPGMRVEGDSARSIMDQLATREEVTLVVQRCERPSVKRAQSQRVRMLSRLTKLRASAPPEVVVDRPQAVPPASPIAAPVGPSSARSPQPPPSPISQASMGAGARAAAMAMEEYRPGGYILAQRAVVAPTVAPCSPQDVVAELPAGTPIQVVEVVALTDIDRVRGRLRDPRGWISLQNLEDGFLWARKLEQELEEQDQDAETVLC